MFERSNWYVDYDQWKYDDHENNMHRNKSLIFENMRSHAHLSSRAAPVVAPHAVAMYHKLMVFDKKKLIYKNLFLNKNISINKNNV